MCRLAWRSTLRPSDDEASVKTWCGCGVGDTCWEDLRFRLEVTQRFLKLSEDDKSKGTYSRGGVCLMGVTYKELMNKSGDITQCEWLADDHPIDKDEVLVLVRMPVAKRDRKTAHIPRKARESLARARLDTSRAEAEVQSRYKAAATEEERLKLLGTLSGLKAGMAPPETPEEREAAEAAERRRARVKRAREREYANECKYGRRWAPDVQAARVNRLAKRARTGHASGKHTGYGEVPARYECGMCMAMGEHLEEACPKQKVEGWIPMHKRRYPTGVMFRDLIEAIGDEVIKAPFIIEGKLFRYRVKTDPPHNTPEDALEEVVDPDEPAPFLVSGLRYRFKPGRAPRRYR